MRYKTEIFFATFLIVIIGFTGVLFWQLLKKYTFVDLTMLHSMCSSVSVHVSYSLFNSVGRTIGWALAITSVLFCVKVLFSFIKTHKKNSTLQYTKVKKIPLKVKKIRTKIDLPTSSITVIQEPKLLAFTLGVFHPQVILSTGLIKSLTAKQLEAVLLHESYHLSNHHPFLFICGEIISSSMSFIPVVQQAIGTFKSQLENEADQFACEVQGSSQFIYQALLTVHQDTELQIFPGFASANFFNRRQVLKNSSQQITFAQVMRSVSFFSILLGLLLTPITVRAENNGGNMSFMNCSDGSHEMCSTYCQPGVFSIGQAKQNQSKEDGDLVSREE